MAPEGGTHQSVINPSIGLEQPACVAWDPCFGQDLEWTLLNALSHLGIADGHSSYFRLSPSAPWRGRGPIETARCNGRIEPRAYVPMGMFADLWAAAHTLAPSVRPHNHARACRRS